MSRYAAIDIGSNSIRMLAAEVDPAGGMITLAAERQVVRLGTGVFRDGRLSEPSMGLACEALEAMAAKYRKLDLLAVRAVGTAALRDAANQPEFLARASTILGTAVEIISGLEEARLVHLGVQSQWPHPEQRILIVDIGGGSAEIILGESGHIVDSFSKPLGAVRLTELFLKSDPPDPRELARLQNYIRERIAGPATRFGASKIDRMIATSSTAAAIVCAVNRVRRSKRDRADRLPATGPQIRRLYREVTAADLTKRRTIIGIGPRRAEIIVAGVAVLNEFIENFRLPRLYYSTAGVREGIIADLANRRVGLAQARLDPDRRRVVQALSRRYGISAPHTRKVAWLAVTIFERLRSLHGLPPVHGQLLEAAAYLYNIGHFVNESRHHKHSLYLVANSDLAGFSEWERTVIANLCRYHRKSMPQPAHLEFQALDAEGRRAVVLLAPLLRLALALDQSQDQRVEDVHVLTQDKTVEIYLRSSQDLDVEEWHAAQVGPVFRETYGLQLAIRVEQ
ncbi:MAG TPA: Ppx/GppA phosphatase family protein [Bryobacteraceae bacterium]|nr:Ppx/GppA phosphatase family protein [Bryobacteraceae bacterium]